MARFHYVSHITACLGAACLLIAGCSLEPVRVGVILPLSGPYASYGVSMEKGARLAADQVNREGGVQGRRLELALRDSNSRPERADEMLRDLLVRQRVPAVVGGGTSAETLAMAVTAEREKRVLLSPSASSPDVTSAGDWVFRNWPSDELEARTMSDFAAFTLHVTRLAVVEDGSAYARGISSAFASQFGQAGRTIERIVLADGGEAAQRVEEGLRAFKPEVQAVYLVGYGEKLIPLQKAIRECGMGVPVLSVSLLSDGDTMKKAAEELEGVVIARPAFDVDGDTPASQEFLADYQKRYGGEPDVYAAHAYDSVKLLAEAMAMEGIAPEQVKRGLLKIKNFPGASGTITFDSNGDIIQSFELCVVRGGRAVPLSRAGDEVLTSLQARVDALRFGG